jgi:tRNA-splicing ligase RtcB
MKVFQDEQGLPVKAWVDGVQVEEEAKKQLLNVASMPFIYRHIAVMPDVHFGKGATIGSVIPTKGAVIPAAVGVDIGCGMCAVRTTLNASDLPDDLKALRNQIERDVPHGGLGAQGGWRQVPAEVEQAFVTLQEGYKQISEKHPKVVHEHTVTQLGSLGGGNHFIEVCLDESDAVWVMLHSGSRGVGNRIGNHFIELAKQDMKTHFINLPDQDLAYLSEGTQHFDDYVIAVEWAQRYAMENRSLMLKYTLGALQRHTKPFALTSEAVNCHHNYVSREHHFGHNVIVTRKGAVSAREGQLGIIPGSMGAKSFIVRGKGNPESFHSCSHGAGRTMSRAKARQKFNVEDHCRATEGVECRKDKDVIDETPAAYKDIDAVMAAQADLVEIVHTLKRVVCVKG